MKAIQVKSFGGPEVLQYTEIEEPEVKAGEVKVRLKAAGLNPSEAYVLTGTYAFYKPDLPFTPGFDGAGIVEAVGEGVQGLKVGDRVFTVGLLAERNTGTYAEKVVVDADCVCPLPEQVSFEAGASLGVPALAAYRALFHIGQLEAGETVLIHGASGAVGSLAVQMARTFGAKVIGTAGESNDQGKEIILESGTHHAISHITEENKTELLELTEGKGPDLIIEMLANENLQTDLEVLAPNGRIVIVGNRGEIEINPRLTMEKEAKILGMAVWHVSEEDHIESLSAISSYLESGSLNPYIGEAYLLSKAREVHEKLLDKPGNGKMILTIDESDR